jgi:pilus assembly protein CpaE
MQIYYFTAGAESDELNDLETRVKGRLPAIRKLTKLEEVTKRIAEQANSPEPENAYIVFPILTISSFDRVVSIADQAQRGVFFIFVSKEISASDYKRLVRSGGADWVSLQDAPHEIEDIVLRASRAELAESQGAKPVIMAFVSSSGGVGNSTLALETAVQLKADKQMRQRRVCLLDLDMQTSHVCDYLDIEARLKLAEIAENPERLDEQLFQLFVSHHPSGIDVLASPRSRQDSAPLTMAALDPLFGMIAANYDILIVDLPTQWANWTRQVLAVCNIAVVSGLNTVPGLRLVADTLAAVRAVQPLPVKIVVALNRCETRLFGGVARGDHISRILRNETALTIRGDSGAATHANNTGIPVSLASPSSKIAKDIRALAALAKTDAAARARQ